MAGRRQPPCKLLQTTASLHHPVLLMPETDCTTTSDGAALRGRWRERHRSELSKVAEGKHATCTHETTRNNHYSYQHMT
eukprot:4750493-Prymnesium_polylepis.1